MCILVIIVIFFSALSPASFTKPDNIVQIFVQSAITILVALGEFFAILIAGIDLSVGSILALSGMITAKLMVAGFHPILAVLIGGILVEIVLGAMDPATGAMKASMQPNQTIGGPGELLPPIGLATRRWPKPLTSVP